MSNAEKVLKIGVAVAIIAAALLLAYGLGYWRGYKPLISPIKPQADTLYVHDTCVQIKPIYVTKIKLDSVRIPVPVHDTINGKDTVFVWLEREQVQWQDSLCKVYASGIQPQVDSVEHYTTQTIIRVPVKQRSRWGIGVQAGAGAGKDGLTPYVGVGVSYNILSW